jgi:outer membrane protein TolC
MNLSKRSLGRSFGALALVNLLVVWCHGSASAGEPPTLTLHQAFEALDAHNLAMAEARARVAQARAAIGQASSALLPTVMAAGGYTRNSDEAKVGLGGLFQALGQPTPPGIPGTLYIQPIGAWTVSGSVRVPLLAPSAWADRAAAQAGSEAARSTVEAVRLQLRAALAQAAWAGAAAEEVVAASERAVAVAEEHRQTAARMAEAGETAPLSVLKADTEVSKRESDLVRAKAELDRARLALGVLLGRAEPVRVLPAAPAVERVSGAGGPGPREALIGEALAQRPELRADAARVRASQAQTLSARLRVLPQLSGSAMAFASDMPYPTGKKDGWRLTLEATWLLFDGGARSSRRAQTEAETEAAHAAAESAQLAISQEVADAAREVGVTAERLRLAEKQSNFAREAAASAKRTFEAGVAGSLDVLDANDRLFQSEVALADARGRLGIARVALAKALGRDMESAPAPMTSP